MHMSRMRMVEPWTKNQKETAENSLVGLLGVSCARVAAGPFVMKLCRCTPEEKRMVFDFEGVVCAPKGRLESRLDGTCLRTLDFSLACLLVGKDESRRSRAY